MFGNENKNTGIFEHELAPVLPNTDLVILVTFT